MSEILGVMNDFTYGQVYTFKGANGSYDQYQCVLRKNFDMYLPEYNIIIWKADFKVQFRGKVGLVYTMNQNFSNMYALPTEFTGLPVNYTYGDYNVYKVSCSVGGNSCGDLIFGNHYKQQQLTGSSCTMKIYGSNYTNAYYYNMGEGSPSRAATGSIKINSLNPGTNYLIETTISMLYNNSKYTTIDICQSNASGTQTAVDKFTRNEPYLDFYIKVEGTTTKNRKCTFSMYNGYSYIVSNNLKFNYYNTNNENKTCTCIVEGTLLIDDPRFFINN